MMSVQELFYGEAEPVWIINTTAAQLLRHHAQPKPEQYIIDQHNPHPTTPQQHNFHPVDSHPADSAAQMGHAYHQLRPSPPPQNVQHQAPQRHHNSIPQKSHSHQPLDQDRQYVQHNQRDQQRQHGPLQQISPPFHPINSQSGTPHNSPFLTAHQPSAPPFNSLHLSSQQENIGHYARPPTQIMRMRVPICCEACEDRVTVSMAAIRGVQSVECDHRKEKVTVTGSAAPADILKACKKLFKRSEMWVDRYY